MKPKKNSTDWYIAATHWLTSMVASGILGAIVIIAVAAFTNNSTIDLIATIIVSPLVMWLAVKMSASYVNKTYVVKNASQIILLSTVYLVIVAGGYRVYGFINTGVFQNEYIGFIIALIVFYIASKKYVKNNV